MCYKELPLVAAAVHQRVNAPVEHAVLGLEAQDPKGAGQVVLTAAAVRLRQSAHLDVVPRAPALPAPLGAGYSEHAGQIPALPARRRVHHDGLEAQNGKHFFLVWLGEDFSTLVECFRLAFLGYKRGIYNTLPGRTTDTTGKNNEQKRSRVLTKTKAIGVFFSLLVRR